MKTKTMTVILAGIVFLMFGQYGQSYAADKVVVIPLNGKAKAQTCTPQYENVTRYLSIPGASFLFEAEASQTYARRESLGGASKGLFAHGDTAIVPPSIIAPVYFPPGADSVLNLGFAICGNSTSTGSVVRAVLTERSMVNGDSSEMISYTIDNSAGNKPCHTLYGGNPGIIPPVDTERNVYYISIYGLEGGGEFDPKRTELDYVRITYLNRELKQFTCQ